MSGPQDKPHAVPAGNGKWHAAVQFPFERDTAQPLIHPLPDMGDFETEDAARDAARAHLDLCEAPVILNCHSE